MYIAAFLLGGILSALFQIFMIFTKLDPPRILILGLGLGALLTPYGMMTALSEWGGAGLLVMVMGAGNAITGATLELMNGNQEPIVLILGLLVILTLMGIAAGSLRLAVIKSRRKQDFADGMTS
ncbi:SpoVA protein [Desulfitobacterium sp. LBE]|uniref:SpoVA protein n=3 Tax=root TaxID=1 RepID=A0A098AYC8_DESHA|nr:MULTISPECIES: SpoVA/SpoVAEb family sporulation membrane protein [Desulfitobacterium]ACL18650.1 hypothetical protein Dhaf_0584 [Desulfitobacterium hafniense DCB-2]MEA5024193.1 SpoVA/SpoVAEb family sporulation membrane protein [Desulfitobacterium hafniense]TWH58436.1 SpoVA protein [Desulfitobacterium sp. LBE]CDX00616.1 SpoVA protein [Desulfitobacterium hafniense]